jgi:hypothetical protein
VGAIKVPPPFYDEVQLATYCLMLGADVGDLVQCVRQGGGSKGSEIQISRVELNEPPTHHRAAWHAHVRPRLQDFAELVHRLRDSTAFRFRYLLAADRSAFLAEELPHLRRQLAS